MRINVKNINVVLFLVSAAFSCKSQPNLNWNVSKEWKIYKTREISSFKLDTTELKNIENTNADSISYFIQAAEKINNNPVWKDFFVTTCIIDGELRKVIFSIYGGFFYDAKSGQYYLVKQELRKPLVGYLKDKLFPK